MTFFFYVVFFLGLVFAHWTGVIVNATVNFCVERCFDKIPSTEICQLSCSRLAKLNTIDNNCTNKGITPSVNQGCLPLVPKPPYFVSHTDKTLTVAWSSGIHHNTPLLYVVEIKSNQSQKDPLIIFPEYQKYHVVSNQSFTSTSLQSKTGYRMRVAALSLYGTRGFSPFSQSLETNYTCQKLMLNETKTIQDLCITNLRVRVTTNIYQSKLLGRPKQRTQSWIYWQIRQDKYSLPLNKFELQVKPLYSTSSNCGQFSIKYSTRKFFSKLVNSYHFNKTAPDGSNIMYMGCKYQIKLKLRHALNYNDANPTTATFIIPECIQGICACKGIRRKPGNVITSNNPKSNHVTISNYQSVNANYTNITVNWNNEPWDGKAAYFRVQLKVHYKVLFTGNCKLIRPKMKSLNVIDKGSHYNVTFASVSLNCPSDIKINAYDIMGCEIAHQETFLFEGQIVTILGSTALGSSPSITSLPTTSTNRIGGLLGTRKADRDNKLTVISIVVPMFIISIVVLLILLFFYKRFKNKQLLASRDPPGLQLRQNDIRRDTSVAQLPHVYHRNADPDSVSINDSSRLLVHLPPKCINGGLELNPAYVEQQIQEAIRMGEKDEFEFGFHRLIMGRKIGKGAFGKVFIAEAYGVNGNPDQTVVAVKVLKDNASADEKDDFKAEINFMKTIGKHENVISMLGCCTLYEPICLLVEYAPYGDLLHYLRTLRKKFEMEKRKCLFLQTESSDPTSPTNRPTTNRCGGSPSTSRNRSISVTTIGREILNMFTGQRRNSKEINLLYVGRNEENNSDPISYDASVITNQTIETTLTGMTNKERCTPSESQRVSLDGALDSRELESFAYQIARGMDYLSSKGVLHRDLAARNILVGEGKILKISDFGMSREGVYVKRSNGKIPLRWLSLEAMSDRVYSIASDVWAFGIVLWEICTLGGFPYPTVNDRDLLAFLMDGHRMEKPSNCTEDIYQLMRACWSANPDERPSFQFLKESLLDMEEDERPYVNVDPNQEICLPPDEGHVRNLLNFSDASTDSLLDENSDLAAKPSSQQNFENETDYSLFQEPNSCQSNQGRDAEKDFDKELINNNVKCKSDENLVYDKFVSGVATLEVEKELDVDESFI